MVGGSAVPVLVSSVQRVNVHIVDAVNSNSRQKQNNSPSHQPIWACRDWPFMVTRRPGRTSPRVAVSIVITTWNSCHWEQRLASSKIENWFSGKFLWPWKRPRKCTDIQNEMMRWTMKISSSHCLRRNVLLLGDAVLHNAGQDRHKPQGSLWKQREFSNLRHGKYYLLLMTSQLLTRARLFREW